MKHTKGEILEKQVFQCTICKKEYKSKQAAINCMNSTDQQIVKVGDIVELRYGFGWFDGDKRWVINPDVDTSKHGFGADCSMGFFYVITHIDTENHRTRYHVMTNAMTGKKGYKGGWTYNKNHYTPKLIDAPEFVKQDSKNLIGKKAKWLY